MEVVADFVDCEGFGFGEGASGVECVWCFRSAPVPVALKMGCMIREHTLFEEEPHFVTTG